MSNRSYLAQFAVEDVAATTAYILVDKSDITNFPHQKDEDLKVFNLRYMIDSAGAGDWVVKVGVVLEVDGTNGSVKWFYYNKMAAALNQIIQTSVPYNGLSLAGPGDNIISGDAHTASVLYQTDVTLANPTGVAVAPAAGDIVVELEEISGTTTIDFSVELEYANVSDK